MVSTRSPTLISPLRESSRRAESLTGLAKPARSFASSLTSRTSRPTGISASGAPLKLSRTATPPFALHPNLVTSRLLRDEVFGPARSPLHRDVSNQLPERLMPPRGDSYHPLHAFARLVRHEDLLVAYQLSSPLNTIFRISQDILFCG